MEKQPYEIALDERNEQDYQAFCTLKALIKALDWNPCRKKVIALIDEYGDDGAGLFENAEEIINEREAANERFTQAIIDAARHMPITVKQA
jgi:hypothetical protein